MDQLSNSNSLNNDDKLWATFCHLSALIGFVVPFGNVIGPLVIWLVKRNESVFIDACGKEAVNFNISLSIWALICIPLCFILIGFLLLAILLVVWVVCAIIASIKANNGEYYRYPLTIRFSN